MHPEICPIVDTFNYIQCIFLYLCIVWAIIIFNLVSGCRVLFFFKFWYLDGYDFKALRGTPLYIFLCRWPPGPYTRPYMTQFCSTGNPYARVQFAGVIQSRSVAACYLTACACLTYLRWLLFSHLLISVPMGYPRIIGEILGYRRASLCCQVVHLITCNGAHQMTCPVLK